MENLYDIYKKVRSEGIKQVRERREIIGRMCGLDLTTSYAPLQNASLGIHRCDYLLHVPEGGKTEDAIIQQVEFNTIASSFGGLSAVTGQLHR